MLFENEKNNFYGRGQHCVRAQCAGDCLCSEVLRDAEFALYDIDAKKAFESAEIIGAMNETMGGHAKVTAHLGVENRKEALRGADFVVNAIQVGLYDPAPSSTSRCRKNTACARPSATRWASAASCGRCAPSLCWRIFARDMEEVCPDALFLNYTNPMAMLYRLYAALYRG